ncbi:MAG: hypothetical protein NT105_07240 [Verrucomicrobia bacterium]|nr:hypothetical protein [Verrucomicrobiota bacterium]
MTDVLLIFARWFLWVIVATLFWVVMFPVVWIVSVPFILVIALFRERPYWRAVVEMLATVHGFWSDCFHWFSWP